MPDNGQIQTPGAGDYIGSLLTVLLSLAVIIVLIVLLIKWLNRKNRMWQMNQSIRTIGGTGLGPNKSLQIIEVGDVVYILGIGEDITLIDKISDPEQAARLMASLERAPSKPGTAWPASWSDLKSRMRRGYKTAETDSGTRDADPSSVSFHEVFHAKLEQMPRRAQQVEQLFKEDSNEDR
ncbi:flagellar biosynthetic protein FliO [Paenibacillus thiaminolyticus]|uniref:Flagellar biogenesis protein n=1 Tax=Paenibacillus thiaminolyticus TaxID=49283 RepID=A0A3A3GH10_PANTH|nr:flagellar biosynthetic protein FliO [Paenibacillus thiaminolyticus]RJG22303.1 flagellar biogenesis protein [Paenibacillus thiaminolyticus]